MIERDQRYTLRGTVEAFPAADGNIYFLRGGADAELVIERPDAAARAIIEALREPASPHELKRLLATPGQHTSDVETALAELDRHGLLTAHPPHYPGLTGEQRERFDRQLAYFADTGGEALAADRQRRLLDARVAIIGCGGLGSWTACALACAGIGALTLVDDDTVSLSNLNRQLLYRRADIGRVKVHAAAEALTAFNPELAIDAIAHRVRSADDVATFVAGADLVIATADDPPYDICRWINEGAARTGVPHLSAGQFPPFIRIGPLYGQRGLGCWECQEHHARERFPLYDDLVTFRQSQRTDAATLGPASGIIGSILAMDAVHLITGLCPPATVGNSLLIDLRSWAIEVEPAEAHPACRLCAEAAAVS